MNLRKRWRIRWYVDPDETPYTKAWAEAHTWCYHTSPRWSFLTKRGAERQAEDFLAALRSDPHVREASWRYIRYEVERIKFQ